MKTSSTLIAGLVGLAIASGCTKPVEVPSLAGPSTLAYSILLTASTDTLIQDGVSSATIEITARDTAGQAINGRPLRAAIIVDGIVQDYGSLNTKTPTTGGTLRYTAPPASTVPGGQVAQTVTVAVTPTDQGDFRNEFARGVDIRLVPQGVILPNNPNLVAAFVVTPAAPQAFSTATFDASTSTNRGTPCGSSCSYSWTFGDGTSGTGIRTTKDYTTGGAKTVVLTVTDSLGATATALQTITVGEAVPPTVSFVSSPSGTAGVNQDIFFNASASRAAPGRTIVSYNWDFGDGNRATGVTTTHRYRSVGSYQVQLSATDDVGTVGRPAAATSITVTSGGPTVTVTASPASQVRGSPIVFNVTATPTSGSTIVSYKFVYGDNGDDFGTAPTQTHIYTAPGTYPVAVTVTDSVGRSTTVTITVTIT